MYRRITELTEFIQSVIKNSFMFALLLLLALTGCGPKVVYYQDTQPFTITYDYTLNWVESVTFWRHPDWFAGHAEWSPDGKHLVTSSPLGQVFVWDMEKRKARVGWVKPIGLCVELSSWLTGNHA
jgi:WD40 repeat protein